MSSTLPVYSSFYLPRQILEAAAASIFLILFYHDRYFKQPLPLVSSTPEVKTMGLMSGDMFCVLATDGILDVLTNQEICDLALPYHNRPEEAAKNIVRTAHKRGSDDNLTAMVVCFGWAEEKAAALLEKLKRRGQLSATGERLEGARSMGGEAANTDATRAAEAEDFDMFA